MAYHDPLYEQTVNTINKNLAGLKSQRGLEEKRVNEDYQTAASKMAKNQEQSLSQLQQKLSGQGIGRSGINVQKTGESQQQYQQNVGQLTQAKTRGLEDIARDIAMKKDEYQSQLDRAEIERSNREIEHEKVRAQEAAQATAAKEAADRQREWMETLQAQLIESSKPVPQPTGVIKPPPPPQQVVQQAVRSIPPPPSPAPPPAINNSGIDHRQLQQMLMDKGFNPGPIDGIMGPRTKAALREWKATSGMPVNDIVDPGIMTVLHHWQRPEPAPAPAPVGHGNYGRMAI